MARANQVAPAKSCRSSTGGKQPPFPPRRFRCPEEGCPWSYHRNSDLTRHLPKHLSAEAKREKYVLASLTVFDASSTNIFQDDFMPGTRLHSCNSPEVQHADPLQRDALWLEASWTKLRATRRPTDEISDIRGPSPDDEFLPPAHPVPDSSSDTTWAPSPSASSPINSFSSANSFPSVGFSDSSFGSLDSDSGSPPAEYLTCDGFPYSPAPSRGSSQYDPNDLIAYYWTQAVEECHSMFDDCVVSLAPTSRPGPAMLYPADQMHLFAQEQMFLADIAAHLAEAPAAQLPFSCAQYDPGFCFDLYNAHPHRLAFEGEWQGVGSTQLRA
ncbi:hypothetical protein DFH07DRAFT_979771 [Mycena maculata]|uniref:C2H2-type domain-containing protein n=1 Tax=Mycena maculata TaxID=230809 RepID=A0AAD7N220_9AGAR|nr:hypothetical protein DFH07DRAFT_979771 [Mycena maculata]